MNPEYIIPKDRVLPRAQDYEFLRQEGMKYIEKLGNKLWTDYNAHDPGITILEVLAYVITELGYRSGFTVADLLTGKNGAIQNGSFFPADQIMVNAPLTEIDYRKLLIDIEGVSNGWLLATKRTLNSQGYYQPNDNEKNVYIDKQDDKLSFSNTNSKGKKNAQLHIRGLNRVFIELDEDPVYGDLNATITEYEFLVENPEKWVQVTIIPPFSNWLDKQAQYVKEFLAAADLNVMVYGSGSNIVTLNITNSTTGNNLLFKVEAYDKNEIADIENYLSNDYTKILELFENKKAKADEIFGKTLVKLQSNRNLTEDFIEVNIVPSVMVSVCAKIELKPQSNPTDVMVAIQKAIYDVLSPGVSFYTLLQLAQQGYSTEDIFTGPRLEHGFLKDEEVIKSQLPTSVHSSDIIAAIMKIEGVQSVNNVLMTAYDAAGNPIAGKTNVSWCMPFPGDVRPTFNRKRSQLQLFQNGIPFLLSEDSQRNIDQQISIYKSFKTAQKLYNPAKDLPVPEGTYYQLGNYYSIQNDFPANYGLGKNKLPESVPQFRKAQVKQLQGYLYFFEQILADLFSQLYNAKELLNTTTLKDSYFTSYLGNINGFYSDEVLTDELKAAFEATGVSGNAVYETQEQFYNRRNRALDHLIARFGESFNDYVFMMYQMQHENTGLGSMFIDNIELIEDKQNFLEAYPQISSNRAIAKNYTLKWPPNTYVAYSNYWNTFNIGGYAERAARLLGINTWPLLPSDYDNPKTYFILNVGNEAVRFDFVNPETQLPQKKRWANTNIADAANYDYKEENPGEVYAYLQYSGNDILKLDKKFSDSNEAAGFINKLIETLALPYEYFYCLEHILLRPFESMTQEEEPDNPNHLSDLLPVCLGDDCQGESGTDPYSFKASIVLPGWMGRFTNISFRKYAEKIFRQEAPAHVLLKICWVGTEDMTAFKKAYIDWCKSYNGFRIAETKKDYTDPVIAKHLKNHRELIKVMGQLNNTYPPGHLYDCHSSEKSSPIILGNSVLGNL